MIDIDKLNEILTEYKKHFNNAKNHNTRGNVKEVTEWLKQKARCFT